jgi:hypothetical protein
MRFNEVVRQAAIRRYLRKPRDKLLSYMLITQTSCTLLQLTVGEEGFFGPSSPFKSSNPLYDTGATWPSETGGTLTLAPAAARKHNICTHTSERSPLHAMVQLLSTYIVTAAQARTLLPTTLPQTSTSLPSTCGPTAGLRYMHIAMTLTEHQTI